MVIDRRKFFLLGAAAALRLSLSLLFPFLPNILTGRVEISTPVTSFKRRKYSFQETQLTGLQFKKASISTLIMYPPMMAASTTRYCLSGEVLC